MLRCRLSTTIPNHPGDISEGNLLRAILKQAGIWSDEFREKKEGQFAPSVDRQ